MINHIDVSSVLRRTVCDLYSNLVTRPTGAAVRTEIENLLLRHPRISQAAVIGVPDARLGEVGMAFVVLDAAGPPLTADEVIAWSRDEMANFKVPRFVEFVDELPINATGKIMKDELRARAQKGSA